MYFSEYWLRGQDLNLAAHPNKITFHRLHLSITALGPRHGRPETKPPPLKPSCEIWIELIREVGRSSYVRAVNSWHQIFVYNPDGNVIDVHQADQK